MNAFLAERGHISMQQLTRHWNLPTELLSGHLLPEVGRRIDAVRFEDQFYTRRRMDALRSRLTAILAAITK